MKSIPQQLALPGPSPSAATGTAAPTDPEERANPFDLLLPYQREWVRDDARFKIWLKSRQIGGSLSAAFELVADAMESGKDWIVLSAGERQAVEFMDKVKNAADIFSQAVEESYLPHKKVTEVFLGSGARILALPANPATARGYSANLVLDEFAFHDDAEAIWRAVYPVITNPLRGDLKLRVLSTPAGRNSKFYDLWENAPDFSRHRTDIYDAREQGLPIDIEELRANLADPDGWSQEFECQFVDQSSQLFPPALIEQATSTEASVGPWEPTAGSARRTVLGIDIGRHHDLTVLWTLELATAGDCLITQEVLVLEGVPYPEQEELILERVRGCRFACIDATGLGGPISEQVAARTRGLEAVVFTAERKREMFQTTRHALQSGRLLLPRHARIREDLASLQRIVTSAGRITIRAARTRDGHADRATALALALRAGLPLLRLRADKEQAAPRTVLPARGRRRLGRAYHPHRTDFSGLWR
jgi:phage FluMu gp28-like protein